MTEHKLGPAFCSGNLTYTVVFWIPALSRKQLWFSCLCFLRAINAVVPPIKLYKCHHTSRVTQDKTKQDKKLNCKNWYFLVCFPKNTWLPKIKCELTQSYFDHCCKRWICSGSCSVCRKFPDPSRRVKCQDDLESNKHWFGVNYHVNYFFLTNLKLPLTLRHSNFYFTMVITIGSSFC